MGLNMNIGDIASEVAQESAAPTASAPTASAAGPINKEALYKRGKSVFDTLTDEEKRAIGSASGTVEFIAPLASHVLKGNIKVKGADSDSFVPIAFKFRLHGISELAVPTIPFEKPPFDLRKKPDFASMATRVVKADAVNDKGCNNAGEFILTRVEMMYMMINPALKLNGYCGYTRDGVYDDKGVYFYGKTAKMESTKDANNPQVIPTPTLNITKSDRGDTGSIKMNMEFIDDENKQVKPEFAERFADLYRSRVGGGRPTAAGLSVGSCSITSLALAEMLGMMNK